MCSHSLAAMRERSDPLFVESLIEAIQLEFGGNPVAVDLVRQFLKSTTYSRRFFLLLMNVARGRQCDSWDVRRLAALMLQEQLLALDVSNVEEFGFVLRKLGLKSRRHKRKMVSSKVLKEGFSTRDLHGFVREFRRKLKRSRCVVRHRRGKKVTLDHWREFVLQSRQDCKLVLGRYLFSPDEIVERIHKQVEVTTGLSVAAGNVVLQDAMRRTMLELPDYEASILRKLLTGTKVYWVGDETTSRLNSLVEYPLGTIVLVIKPPGSDIELEIKRAGCRGEHPLSVRTKVPPSHRLYGGSMLSALQWDLEKTTVFDNVYRNVHGEPAPISRIVHIAGKFDVPLRGGCRPIMEYLSDPTIYGEGFDEMRAAMVDVVDCFRKERGGLIDRIPGDLGLTLQFLTFAGPGQAIISNSSSFRLNLLMHYLSENGPEEYFQRGLQSDYAQFDARRLADDLLDEILPVYRRPKVLFEDYGRYVEAAFAVPGNRFAADKVFLTSVEQIGRMWGTLLGLRGYSFGESFVARNVGLRKVFVDGKWKVQLVFQDHDNLVVPAWDESEYRPLNALRPTRLDSAYIGMSPDHDRLDSELLCLKRIYRVDDAVVKKGRQRLRKCVGVAYLKTQRAVTSRSELQSLLNRKFCKQLFDWDAVAQMYIARNGSGEANWKPKVREYLKKKGYRQELIDEYSAALEEYGEFVDEHAFLYQA